MKRTESSSGSGSYTMDVRMEDRTCIEREVRRVKIVQTKTVETAVDQYTQYTLEIRWEGGGKRVVTKRYADFEAWYGQLRAEYVGLELAPMPSKFTLRDKLSREVVEERSDMLQAVLNSVLGCRDATRSFFTRVFLRQFDFAGRAAVISDGLSPLGQAVAVQLAEANATVYVCGPLDSQWTSVEAALRERAGSDRVFFRELDLASPASVDTFAATLAAADDPVAALVLDAVVYATGATPDGLALPFGVNCVGQLRLLRAMLPLMERAAPSALAVVLDPAYRSVRQLTLDGLRTPTTPATMLPWLAGSHLALLRAVREFSVAHRDTIAVSAIAAPSSVSSERFYSAALRLAHRALYGDPDSNALPLSVFRQLVTHPSSTSMAFVSTDALDSNDSPDQMGNYLVSSQTSHLGQFLDDLPQRMAYDQMLGSGRFLKTLRCLGESSGAHREEVLVAKLFIHPPGQSQEDREVMQVRVSKNREKLEKLRGLFSELRSANVLTYSRFYETPRAALLSRPYVMYNLYDRIGTRPFLTRLEKLWVFFQLLRGLSQAHALGVVHRDIKSENVLVTSWMWVFLSDWASYKPKFLPEDNPYVFSYYYDAGGRRTCYLAPERFYPQSKGKPRDPVMPSSDIFSLGCVIGELFMEGVPLFDFSRLVRYIKGDYEPSTMLARIDDPRVRALVAAMIDRSPKARPTADELLASDIFPPYFSFLHDYVGSWMTLDADERVLRLWRERGLLIRHFSESAPPPSTDRETDSVAASPAPADEPAKSTLAVLSDPFQQLFNTEKLTSEVVAAAEHLDAIAEKDMVEAARKLYHSTRPTSSSRAATVTKVATTTTVVSDQMIEGPCEPLVFVLTLLCSSVRNVRRNESKLVAVDMLNLMADALGPSMRLHRIVPYLTVLLSDRAAVLRSAALRVLARVLAAVDDIAENDVQVFHELVLPAVQNFHTDPVLLVRQVLVEVLPTIARSARAFLDAMHLLRQQSESEQLVGTRSEPTSSSSSSYDEDLRDIRRGFHTIMAYVLTKERSPSVRVALIRRIDEMCEFFGRETTVKQILPHLVMFISSPTWEVRHALMLAAGGIARIIGKSNTENFLYPCLLQSLSDSEDLIVCSAYDAVALLTDAGFFSKETLLKIVSNVAPQLLHPNALIRSGSLATIAAILEKLAPADVQCFVAPLLRPYMRDVPPRFTAEYLAALLLPPIPSDVYSLVLSRVGALLDTTDSPAGDDDEPPLDPSAVVRASAESATDSHDVRRRVELLTELFCRVIDSRRACSSQSDGTIVSPPRRRSTAERASIAGLKGALRSQASASVSAPSADTEAEAAPAVKPTIPSSVLPGVGRTASSCLPRDYTAALSATRTRLAMPPTRSTSRDITLGDVPEEPMSRGTVAVSGADVVDEATTPTLATSSMSVGGEESVGGSEADGPLGYYVGAQLPDMGQLWRMDNGGSQPLKGTSLRDWRPNGIALAHMHEHAGAVTQLCASRDNMFFASGSDDGSVKVWDCLRLVRSVSSRSRLTYSLQAGRVRCLTLCENSHSVVAATDQGSIHVFRVDYTSKKDGGAHLYTGVTHVKRINTAREGSIVALHHGDSACGLSELLWATQLGTVRCMDLRSPVGAWSVRAARAGGLVTSMAVDPQRHYFAVCTDAGDYELWDMRFHVPLRSWRQPEQLPVHRLEVAQTARPQLFSAAGNQVEVWDLESFQRTRVLRVGAGSSDAEVCAGRIRAALWPNAASYMLTAGADRTVRFWDLVSPQDSLLVSHPREMPHMTVADEAPHACPGFVPSPFHDSGLSTVIPDVPISDNPTVPQPPSTFHHDCITDMCLLELPSRILLSSSRDGVIKAFS